MVYISLKFYWFVGILFLLYYLFSAKYRWMVLLAGSLGFYYKIGGEGWQVFGITLLASYFMGRILDRLYSKGAGEAIRKAVTAAFVIAAVVPLAVTKNGDFVLSVLLHRKSYPWIIPMGLSFYTLQIVSYLVDISRGRIKAQKNLGKYALFVSFFPQIVQGPIPRYEQLEKQLYEGHSFQEKEFCKGLQMILWGFFLKLMIADKASIVVNTIFDNWKAYRGCYVLVAGILYSMQLYSDFLSCVCLAQGTAQLFGIHLTDNFCRPYQAESIKEFWSRWHISLSTWLKDYIYIPLGGNRKGRLRKYFNILVTFTVSGIWHGAGYKYIFWGWLHGIYQIGGELTRNFQNKVYDVLGMPEGQRARSYARRTGTCFWVMLAWIIFRAGGLKRGLSMVYSMVSVYNPWIFFDDSLFRLGLSWKEWGVLIVSVLILARVSKAQETMEIREEILKQPLVIQWGIYLGAVAAIMIFGTYGFGFNASDFIYGGF